ncbi:uncharacterized protein G2W53_038324 [Senna tora]|uniref:Uncharacterized protein n=1 Tax=Senna tora TaxID=362788 RepID=A0A834W215_9FABA|nr:uncharacterized protein G2W53_038324 [Senna tora]
MDLTAGPMEAACYRVTVAAIAHRQ